MQSKIKSIFLILIFLITLSFSIREIRSELEFSCPCEECKSMELKLDEEGILRKELDPLDDREWSFRISNPHENFVEGFMTSYSESNGFFSEYLTSDSCWTGKAETLQNMTRVSISVTCRVEKGCQDLRVGVAESGEWPDTESDASSSSSSASEIGINRFVSSLVLIPLIFFFV
eukprot:gb/GECH01003481.1/.p1 GENE.gb/GECH01003481.1/~~gb/GECH01003481.1/.p1  ORF type:complete len:174 (+),score=31.03 gb/GECH01003481.1/:1-522(+)